jgi:hypothetical protein
MWVAQWKPTGFISQQQGDDSLWLVGTVVLILLLA